MTATKNLIIFNPVEPTYILDIVITIVGFEKLIFEGRNVYHNYGDEKEKFVITSRCMHRKYL